MRVLLVLLLSMTVARAEVGASFLGLCNPTFPCGRLIQTFNGHPIVTGWLEGSFGERCKCGDRILRQNKPKTIRVHLLNGPCMRNSRCGSHEYFYGLTPRIASKRIRRRDPELLEKYRTIVLRLKTRLDQSRGGLTCYVSPCLECDLSNPARRVLFRIASNLLPDCVLVDNPYNRECLQGKVCEKHGDKPRTSQPCIVDLDGKDGKEVDFAAYRRSNVRCDMVLYWEPWMNCIRPGEFVDPIARDCKYPQAKFTRIGKTIWN